MSKLTDQQIVQLKPIIRKFTELLDNIEKGDPKRIPRLMKDFEKTKFPKFSPPFLKTANAFLANRNGETEKAIVLAREVADTKTTEGNICNTLIHIFKTFNESKYLTDVYQRIIDANPNEPDPLLWNLPFQLSISNFVKAQELAMKYVQLSKNHIKDKEVSIIFAAVCSYFRAKFDKPMYYKFAVKFIDSVTYRNPDLAEIKVNSLLNEDPNNRQNFETALSYLQTKEIADMFSYNPLQYLRMLIKIHKALGNNDKIGQLASQILREVNADSLDEWKLVVEHCQDAENIINELASKNEKLRGPQLARIELALHQKKDALPFIIEYANKYSEKPYLLGDIKPYLTNDVLPKLADVKDSAIQCLVKNSFTGEVDGERTANMRAQDLLRKNDRNSFIEAANVLSPYKDQSTSRVFLMRIAGLLGATTAQNKLWTEQKLEGIQYLSLLSLYFGNALRSWDLETLRTMAKHTISFCEKGTGQSTSHINAAINNYNFLVVDMATAFLRQITNNISLYGMKVINDWLHIIEDPANITPFKFEKYVPLEKVEQLEERTDESVFPLFFNDETLHSLVFPSARNEIKLISATTRILFAMKLAPSNVKEYVTELASITTGDAAEWKVFADFVQSECKTLNLESCNNVFVLGSLALAAKLANSSADIKEKISSTVAAASENLIGSLKLDELPEVYKTENEGQTKAINSAKELIMKILK
ncbi:hypothetical protein TRFO_23496 [Tritrichomonas foetus]|uniref:Uncharacterized protein n=1 Tax=Tritrichomonas foetus TaxID=1144522 RepID=A0A1J4KB47_9EUKA|nr:hypothetical protein TRFO_23496 [Tritrichomonas foetus]|eukprot:OHT08128.1 hypothetical protein TRFO_23496 [Tritrichomonas foetus]